MNTFIKFLPRFSMNVVRRGIQSRMINTPAEAKVPEAPSLSQPATKEDIHKLDIRLTRVETELGAINKTIAAQQWILTVVVGVVTFAVCDSFWRAGFFKPAAANNLSRGNDPDVATATASPQ